MPQPPMLDVEKLKAAFKSAEHRMFFLDYDGTLAPIVPNPEDASPSKDLLELMRKLSHNPKNSIYIISGRDRKTLEKWVGDLPIGLSAEHGAFLRSIASITRSKGVPDWKDSIAEKKIDLGWKDEILKTFGDFKKDAKQATVEAKEYAITLHYRNCNKDEIRNQLTQLKEKIKDLTQRYPTLDVRKGKKSWEARVKGITKGFVISEILEDTDDNHMDFVLCMGDDITDEDMFHELQGKKSKHPINTVYTVTVGKKQNSDATAMLEKQADVIKLLSALSES